MVAAKREYGKPLTIKDAAEEIGCSVSALKRWEKEPGFPVPRRSDTWKKWRVYTHEDVKRITAWLEARSRR